MSPPEEVVHLEPCGAFHLGERGIGLEETAELVHADTLHAALVSAAAALDGRDAAEYLAGADPPVLLSSAFPFAGPVRFYPRPMIPPREAEAQPAPDVRWKDVAFISEQLLAAHLAGRPYPLVEALHDGTALLSREEAEALRHLLGARSLAGLSFWAKATVPRVVLDAVSQRSGI
jgi:CRISPR-associated protein Csm4